MTTALAATCIEQLTVTLLTMQQTLVTTVWLARAQNSYKAPWVAVSHSRGNAAGPDGSMPYASIEGKNLNVSNK